ncbi:MAG: radical SAM protein [Selenomonadaceae bacterium]|nr:radical SAM protein [Selenomonadaceae bacterium]
MRTSTYEIILPLIGKDGVEIEDYALLVNGIYGAFDVVEKNTAEKIASGDVSALPPECCERLMMRGHLTEKDEAEELYDATLLARIFSKIYSEPRIVAAIMPTYNCNFRCPYCFERSRLGHDSEWLESVIKPSMVNAVFSALAREQKRGRYIDSLILFGGEPFLADNRAIVMDICERARKLNIPIRAITNGYEMDAFLDIITEYRLFGLQISVDGMGETHDKQRRHKNGLPTYERIMDNIALALERGANVGLRVNVNRRNIDGIGELIADMEKRGFTRNDNFSYGFKAVEESANSPNYVTDREVLDALIAVNPEHSELFAVEQEGMYADVAFGLRRAMKKEDFPYLISAYCNAEQGMIIIDPFGNIFPCAYLVDDEDEITGVVDKECGRFLYGFRKAKWDARTGEFLEPCKKCPYIFFCGGGCAVEAKNKSGDPFKSSCGGMKDIWNYTASRIAASEWAEKGEEELTLSRCNIFLHLTEEKRDILEHTRSVKEMMEILTNAGFWRNREAV